MEVRHHPELVTRENLEYLRLALDYWARPGSDLAVYGAATLRELWKQGPQPCDRFRPDHRKSQRRCVVCGASRQDHRDVQLQTLFRIKQQLSEPLAEVL